MAVSPASRRPSSRRPPSPRKPRADAARNRQRLIKAARACFAKTGAATTLEEIARAADVGIGTLYRHFPTREALVEQVYRDALDGLAADAERLAKAHPPLKALREWLLLFVDYIATKKLMADLLATLTGSAATLHTATGPRLETAIGGLMKRAAANGDIRQDVEPFDLLRAIAGLAYASAATGWEARARKMVDILLAGLQRT